MKGHGLRSSVRASLNLEMSLIISLLVLACVASLSWMGSVIANQFDSAEGALGVAGGASGPSDGTATDNGDGSYDIGWSGGTPPFRVIHSPQPDLSNNTIIAEDLPTRSYTIPGNDLLPGDNYIGVIDSDGLRLPTPMVITEDSFHIVAVGGDIPTKTGWAVVSPDGADFGLSAISTSAWMRKSDFLTTDIVVAVGGGGHIYKSTDGGTSWTNVYVHYAGIELWAVDFADETHGWAVGNFSFALRTTDGGATWTEQLPRGATTSSLADVHAVDANTAWACGRNAASGEVFFTTDGGTTWNSTSPIGTPCIGIEVSANGTIWVAALSGEVYKSTDSGASWSLSTTGPSANSGAVNDIISVVSDDIVFVLNRTRILRTTDGGISWTVLNPGPFGEFTGIQVIDSQVWVSAMYDGIYRSRNSGTTWEAISSGTTQALYGIAVHRELP